MAEEFKVEARLTDEQIQDIADMTSTFGNTLGAAEAKRVESVAATREKDIARTESERLVRPIVERIKTEPAMTETIMIGMRITPPSSGGRTSRSPQQPQNLVANMEGVGRVRLEWDANGNTSGTQYVIEMQKGDSGEFTLVDVVTRRTFDHEDAPTGTRLTYRVKARRSDEVSDASNLATVRA